jgi:EpsI family protein
VRIPQRSLIVGAAMLAAGGLAVAMKPTVPIADLRPKVDLESMIPRAFSEWSIDTSLAPVQVSPEVKAKLDEVYDQTLSRTYINDRGQRVMLSIAYGGRHGEGMQTHRPEICYPAQGFTIDRVLASSAVQTVFGSLRVNRLVASHGQRIEPITYWVVVGEVATEFGIRMKLAQLRYSVTGRIPDGILIRVSSIDRDDGRAYKLQEQFIGALLASLNETHRLRVMGKT